MNQLGTTLALLRVARGHSQAKLSRLSGIKRSSISGYEQGKVTPDSGVLRQLLTTLNFSWSALDRASEFLERLETGDSVEWTAGHSTSRDETIRTLSEEFGRSSARLGKAFLTLTLEAVEAHRSEGASEHPPLPSDRLDAPALWERIEHQSPEEQRLLIRTEPELRSWALVEHLCERSERFFAVDPATAIQLADLAVFTAERCPGTPPWKVRLVAYALAHLGNALRVSGNLRRAEEAFARVAAWWSVGSEADPAGLLDEVRVLALLAALRNAQRRFPDALELLDRALASSPKTPLRCRLLVSKARALEESGEPQAAIPQLEAASLLVDRELDPRLFLSIHHNMVLLLANNGRAEEAKQLLPDVMDLSRTLGTALDQVRLLWVAAKVALEHGDADRAANLYLQVRAEFAKRHISYDTALVSLELAALYAGQGRTDEVKTIARSLVPIFQANDVHREALAALTLFRQAAEKEEVTVDLARRLVSYLHRARFDPELRFR